MPMVTGRNSASFDKATTYTGYCTLNTGCSRPPKLTLYPSRIAKSYLRAGWGVLNDQVDECIQRGEGSKDAQEVWITQAVVLLSSY